MEAADAVEAGNGDLRQVATQSGLQRENFGRRFYRHGVDDQAAAGFEPVETGIDDTGIARAAADEDGVGIGKTGKAGRRFGFNHMKVGNAEA
ncbi:MAG: hypothetical protein H6R00_3062 [Proteobacteria bacterium]|nr:hypothetical protein [Pseudomonadota bacterium]